MSSLLSLLSSMHTLTSPPTIYVCCSGTNESHVLLLVERQSKEGTLEGRTTWRHRLSRRLDRYAEKAGTSCLRLVRPSVAWRTPRWILCCFFADPMFPTILALPGEAYLLRVSLSPNINLALEKTTSFPKFTFDL